MKFGDTLHQRSVPQWAAYNVNYNEIKRLIKERTSVGLAVPVTIPGPASSNRWTPLENDLYIILKAQHDNVSLFLKSKYGEIDRRLGYLEKQVRSAQKAASLSQTSNPSRTRRLHKVLEDAGAIGQDVQNLTRFASVQKTAFRKLLKKYRKWTGSTTLQTRLESEVFSTGQLNLDYVHPLERVASQSRIATNLLQGSVQDKMSVVEGESKMTSPAPPSTTTVSGIASVEDRGPIALDAALATIPFGKSSGCATYWIHSDNLDEAQALLLHYVHEVHKPRLARQNSVASHESGGSQTQPSRPGVQDTHVAFFDNPQRLLQDSSANKPSTAALSGRWCDDSEAAVTLSNLAPWNPSDTVVYVKRKDIFTTLRRKEDALQDGRRRSTASLENMKRVQEYLSEHRDVKPLAQVDSVRSRYAGTSNSTQTGVWALLDTDILITPLRNNITDWEQIENGELFPHAVLTIRWEFSHMPEVVRAFDTTHLAERVRGFTLESAALHASDKQLPAPFWKPLLDKDIRKVPLVRSLSSRRGSPSQSRANLASSLSDPSSAEGAGESVFSGGNPQSSNTSVSSPNASTEALQSFQTTKSTASADPNRPKKKARIDAKSPPPRQSRYWNEFDDGDQDVNPQEAYVIYVDPNESFLGAETMSKVFGTASRTFKDATARIGSLLSMRSQSSPPQKKRKKLRTHERSPLLANISTSNSEDGDESSDSDSTPTEEQGSKHGPLARLARSPRAVRPTSRSMSRSARRSHPFLTPRQQTIERTYFMSCTGLIIISYVMLFVSGILLITGRRKAYIEVDVAAVAGIATAGACGLLSAFLMWMMKTPMNNIQRIIAFVALCGIVTICVAETVEVINRSIEL